MRLSEHLHLTDVERAPNHSELKYRTCAAVLDVNIYVAMGDSLVFYSLCVFFDMDE